jgi:hypothetical protein
LWQRFKEALLVGANLVIVSGGIAFVVTTLVGWGLVVAKVVPLVVIAGLLLGLFLIAFGGAGFILARLAPQPSAPSTVSPPTRSPTPDFGAVVRQDFPDLTGREAQFVTQLLYHLDDEPLTFWKAGVEGHDLEMGAPRVGVVSLWPVDAKIERPYAGALMLSGRLQAIADQVRNDAFKRVRDAVR